MNYVKATIGSETFVTFGTEEEISALRRLLFRTRWISVSFTALTKEEYGNEVYKSDKVAQKNIEMIQKPKSLLQKIFGL